MISPCYTDTYKQTINTPVTHPKSFDYLDFKRRKIRRNALLKKQQQAALRRLIFFTILGIIAFIIFLNFSYKHIYLPVKNSSLNIEVRDTFLNSTTSMLATPGILGEQYFLENPYLKDSKPLMMDLPLNNELTDLKNRLLTIVGKNSNFTPGIFIWDSKTNNYVSINGNRAFPTASIIKVPILIELFRRIDLGLISLDDKVRFSKHHLASGSGGLQYSGTGKFHSIDYIARIMIQHSDNSATNIILDEIGGMAVLNKAMKAWGTTSGEMHNWLPDLTGTNVMSPQDYASMLYNIAYNDSLLTDKSRDKILGYMSNIRNRNLINNGMPRGSTIAHKTGDIGAMIGDAGLITMPDGRQLIIVAMIERPWNSYRAKEMVREAARITYKYFN